MFAGLSFEIQLPRDVRGESVCTSAVQPGWNVVGSVPEELCVVRVAFVWRWCTVAAWVFEKHVSEFMFWADKQY